MGLLRLIATAALVWFVFRWLDRWFGGPRSSGQKRTHSTSRGSRNGARNQASQPKDHGLGDYVDFEEIDEP